MENNNSPKTQFAGLELSNPIIVSSCSLTGEAKSVKTFVDAGAGAVVLKSLFEEDIIRESAALSEAAAHSEAADYMHAYVAANALCAYIELIEECKAFAGSTKIIASINCANSGEWVEYARAIEKAGADALELNVMTTETDAMAEDGALERRHMEIAKAVSAVVNIPVIMKLSAMLSNHVSLISRLTACGVAGFVMFNRAYPLDINLETMTYTHGSILGVSNDFSTSLRHVAITSAAAPKASLALSGGVQSGECVIKAILAGASAVSVCSTLYREGTNAANWISQAVATVEWWQEKQGYSSIESFRGMMNSKCDEHRDSVMRTQFLKNFSAYKK